MESNRPSRSNVSSTAGSSSAQSDKHSISVNVHFTKDENSLVNLSVNLDSKIYDDINGFGFGRIKQIKVDDGKTAPTMSWKEAGVDMDTKHKVDVYVEEEPDEENE